MGLTWLLPIVPSLLYEGIYIYIILTASWEPGGYVVVSPDHWDFGSVNGSLHRSFTAATCIEMSGHFGTNSLFQSHLLTIVVPTLWGNSRPPHVIIFTQSSCSKHWLGTHWPYPQPHQVISQKIIKLIMVMLRAMVFPTPYKLEMVIQPLIGNPY